MESEIQKVAAAYIKQCQRIQECADTIARAERDQERAERDKAAYEDQLAKMSGVNAEKQRRAIIIDNEVVMISWIQTKASGDTLVAINVLPGT